MHRSVINTEPHKKGNDNDITEKFDFPVSPAKLHEAVRSMLSCGAAFSLREANDTEMKTTFTPYDSDDVLTATVNADGDESKITLSAQDSSNTGRASCALPPIWLPGGEGRRPEQ